MNEIGFTWFLFGKQSNIPEEYFTKTHFDFYRLYYVIDGECVYEDEKGAMTLGKGGIYLLPKKKYSLRYGSHSKFEHIWGHFQIEGWNFDTVLKFENQDDAVFHNYVRLICEISELCFVPPSVGNYEMASIFSDDDYFVVVEKIFTSMVHYLRLGLFGKEKHASPIIEIIEYINNNLSEDLSNDTLAEKARYSRTYFIQEFTKIHGIPPQKYVVKARISKAIAYLMNGEKIYHIAYKVGYDNSKSFARAFKRETGLSPQDYKALHYSSIHEN